MRQIDRILVGFDFSPCSMLALQHAIDLAGAADAELDILFVEVLHGETLNEATRRKLTQLVNEQLHLRDKADLKVTESVERYFAAAPAILDHAESRGADLIVLGTHGRRGLRALMLGSVAQEIVRGADVPVLTVRDKSCRDMKSRRIEKILVPFDFSIHSRRALEQALDVAEKMDASITVLHVIEERFHPAFYGPFFQSIYDVDPDIEKKTLRHLEGEIAAVKDSGVDMSTDVAAGYPGTEISAYADEHQIGLIVMSTHGLAGLERLSLGSVTERTLSTAHCPVLTLRFHKDENSDEGLRSEASHGSAELKEV